MENINKYLTSIDNPKSLCDILEYSNIESYILNYKKMNIYNNTIKRPCQKIWIITPKLKLLGKIYIPNEHKQIALLTIILYELDEDVMKLKNFITTIENNITLFLYNKNYHNLKLKSCIKNSEIFFPTITIQLPFVKNNDTLKFNFDIYNINNNKITTDDVESGSYIKVLLELSDVWISEKEYGINWKILQMKNYPEFNFNKCIFNDTTDTCISNTINNIIPPSPPIPPIIKINKNNIEKQNSSFTPSLEEITNTIKKLKKIPIDEKKFTELNSNKIKKKKKKIVV